MEKNRRSIFVQLEEEHDQLKDLLEKATKCENRERKAYLAKIKRELVPHARGEEKTLYSVLKNIDVSEKLDGLVNESYAEHETADELLSKLESMDPNDDMWLANLKVMKENIEHHIREEENHFFPRAKKYIPTDLSAQMLESYLMEKEKYSQTLPSQARIDSRTAAASLRN